MPQDHAEQVRSFNRFYTRQIGLLREGLLETAYSLTQARILYELGMNAGVRSSALVETLGLDAGYLSRLLQRFERRGLVKRTASKRDGRVQHLALTAQGQREFEKLNTKSRAQAGEMLGRMSEPQQARLIESMSTIREMLEPAPPTQEVKLRAHRVGDIGWVIARHGEVYSQEYGWDVTFEGLVAEIAGKFLTHFDAERERCWIAEYNGRRAGCIFLVKQSRSVAKLRLLLVEPWARGLGVGSSLVRECLRFAQESGYKKMILWTNHILHAARHIYEKEGFRLVREEPHRSFGHDLTGQVWERKLWATNEHE